jgi:type I restriction enzyme S subunit
LIFHPSVNILGSLDDKIELNRQMNKTLEAMAQAIFKSWFVDFDPVRAKMESRQPVGMDAATAALFPNEFEDTALGMIPRGWRVDSLESVCQRITDGSHFSPKSVESGYPMASVKDMDNWGINYSSCRNISKMDYEKLVANDCKPLANDVLIAKDGSFLKHVFVVDNNYEFVILSSIAILRPKNKMNPYLLAFMLKESGVFVRLTNIVSGAVIQRIVLKDFKKFQVIIPPEALQLEWFLLCKPILQKIYSNNEDSKTLQLIKQILLPRLISGVIQVD